MAVAITAAAYLADGKQNEIRQTLSALQWARQIASQAEGMSVAARHQGQEDPMGWAIGFLGQGVEPRVMRIFKHQDLPGEAREEHRIDAEASQFIYTRIFTPEDGLGVRIQIQLDYLGVFGAKTKLANDLYLAALFFISFALLSLATGRFVAEPAAEPASTFGLLEAELSQPPAAKPDAGLRGKVLAWVGRARGTLNELGVHIREMVRDATQIATAAGRSQQAVAELREKIHAELTLLRAKVKSSRRSDAASAKAEVLALNLMIEAAKVGEDGSQLAEMAGELHRHILKMKQSAAEARSELAQLEQRIEPWATDADQAIHAFEGLFKSTQKMDGSIRKTTEALLDQARSIKDFNTDLSAEADGSGDEVIGGRRA